MKNVLMYVALMDNLSLKIYSTSDMKILWIFLFSIPLFASKLDARGVNGGVGCAICTISFGITGQLAEIHNETIFAASLRFCRFIPHPLNDYCRNVVNKLEPLLVDKKLTEMFTPDILCYGLGFCYVDSDQSYCHLFPRPEKNFHKTVEQAKKILSLYNCKNCWSKEISRFTYNWCLMPGIRKICEIFLEGWMEMSPVFDADGDMFSLFESARGSHWRGRDCRDWDSASYPGSKPVNGDTYYDSNCNGIWGVNNKTGLSWEETLCEGSGSRGLIVLGDSVSAHFHFPEVWMNPSLITSETYHNLTDHLFDELDWPHLGFVTGFENASEPLLIQGKTDSLYWRLRALNHCNHRDYQNICRNGASSFDLLSYVENVARNHFSDKPAIVMYAAVGNDVCNSYQSTIENMTSPEQLRNNVVHVLQRLNNILPNGSHVLLVGLVDGGFIFPTMANRIHPLGKLHGNIRYLDVYRWFTCMEIGPCVGWMTSNETLRHFTSKRANELSKVLQKISVKYKFDSYELHYLDNPFHKVLLDWKVKGKPLWQLIDPIDSLHPAQVAQPLIADALWEDIISKFPHILGKENERNAVIQELFGDQGGH